MQVIRCRKSRNYSVNFIDTNDVYVGFDAEQDCCEHAGWKFILPDGRETAEDTEDPGLAGFVFDTTFCDEREDPAEYDAGGEVRFRLTKGKDAAYLVLFNAHNGYYGHGFEMMGPNGKLFGGSI